MPENHAPERDEKALYKVYDYGNYPLVLHEAFGEKDLRPKGGLWRMKQPCDANWEPRDPEKELLEKQKKAKALQEQ